MSGGGTRRLFVAGAEAHGEEERGRQGDEGRGFRAHGAIVAGAVSGVDGEGPEQEPAAAAEGDRKTPESQGIRGGGGGWGPHHRPTRTTGTEPTAGGETRTNPVKGGLKGGQPHQGRP